jgi:hypothetical protein
VYSSIGHYLQAACVTKSQSHLLSPGAATSSPMPQNLKGGAKKKKKKKKVERKCLHTFHVLITTYLSVSVKA